MMRMHYRVAGYHPEDRPGGIQIHQEIPIARSGYWYGLYGDFRVVMDKTSGYVNATKMCRAGGKDYKDWSRLKGTQELIQTLQILNYGDEGLQSTHNEENALQGTPGRSAPIPLHHINLYSQQI